MTAPILLRALRGETTERRPLWIMRQAGRYLPEYRALRAKHSFESLSRDPALAAEVTLQPLARFPLDAAIIFADLMSPVPALGHPVKFDPGPVIAKPVRTRADVDALKDPALDEIAPEVIEALRALAAQDSGLVFELLAKLTELIARYALRQAEAGADAVQFFDTWAGVLSLADWNRLVRPHLVQLIDATKALGIPRIMFVQDAPHLIAAYAELQSEALAVDWREDLAALRHHVGAKKILQGNLDPAILLAGPEATRKATRELLSRVPPQGHIVNLGHGIMPEAPIASVEALIETVHEEGKK